MGCRKYLHEFLSFEFLGDVLKYLPLVLVQFGLLPSGTFVRECWPVAFLSGIL